jgi:hypothetical protein
MFKIGDKVICISNYKLSPFIEYGEVYTVLEYCEDITKTIRVDQKENWWHYSASKFILYSPLIEALI